MKHPVRLERHSGVAVISIDNPPVNAMGVTVRAGILAALNAAADDAAIEAIVLSGKGRCLTAGADITEFDKPLPEPGLPMLCDVFEACEKPVISAMHGTVLGGGVELSVACHYRIADKSARLGLPEIKLGLLPGAGGTQRVPRLIGAGPALDLILSGTQISASDALELGLVDKLHEGDDLRDAAIAFAREKIAKGPYRTGDLRGHLHDGVGFMEAVNQRRAKVSNSAFAEQKILDCVEAALLVPFETGLAMESRAFMECLETPTSKGLRHAFFAERRVAKFPETGEARAFESVAIVGGTDGIEIAVACMNAGLAVTIVEEGEDGIGATLDRIGPLYEASVEAGRMSETAATQALSRMNLTTKVEEISEADIVIEAVGEEFDLKLAVLELIALHAKPGAVIASQGAIFKVEDLSQATGRVSDFAGLHFFEPAHLSRIVEVVPGQASDASTVLTLRNFAKKLGKLPVRVAGGVGLAGDRLRARMRQMGDAMLVLGAQPDQIDEAILSFGFARGIFEEQDQHGLDVAAETRAVAPLPDAPTDDLFEKMCLAGWFGRKSGRGYYTYAKGDLPDGINPELNALTKEIRDAHDLVAREFSSRDILDWILMSLVNEAATLIEEQRISHPSDIDVIMVHELGYPKERGGPILDADAVTIWEVNKRISRLAAANPELWQVSPLLEVLASERQQIGELYTS